MGIRVTLLLLCAVVVMAMPSPAATLVHLTLDEMNAQSSAVVRARCVSAQSQTSSDEFGIVTQYGFEAHEYYKGDLGSRFTLTEPGGQVGNRVVEFSGMPHFRVGDEVVVFVWTSPRGSHQVIGFTQGKFGVRTDAATGDVTILQTASGEPMLEPETHTHTARPERMTFTMKAFAAQMRLMNKPAVVQQSKGGKQ